MLGPGTLSKRLIAFAFLLRAVRAGIGILEVRAPRRAADKLGFAQLRLLEHVMRNPALKMSMLLKQFTKTAACLLMLAFVCGCAKRTEMLAVARDAEILRSRLQSVHPDLVLISVEGTKLQVNLINSPRSDLPSSAKERIAHEIALQSLQWYPQAQSVEHITVSYGKSISVGNVTHTDLRDSYKFSASELRSEPQR